MIQYIKYHKDKYIFKLVGSDPSVASNDQSLIKANFDELQDKFFPSSSKNSIIYYVNNNNFYLMKIRDNRITTAHGIYGSINSVDYCPILCCDLLSTENIIDETSLNVNLELPRTHDLPNTCDKNYIFPKLIDAILSNKKNIIIYVKNEQEFISYVYILFELLPLKLRNKLSVVFNSQLLMDDRNDENRIKLFFTDNSTVLDGNYDSSNYVFNSTAINDRDLTNYVVSNQVLVDFYQQFEIYVRENRLNEIKSKIWRYDFFNKDGNVDLYNIEKAVVLSKFDSNKNIDTAKEVLEFYFNNHDKMNEDQIVIMASRLLLKAKLHLESLQILKKLFTINEKFRTSLCNDYFNYLVEIYIDNITSQNKATFELLDEILSVAKNIDENSLFTEPLNKIFPDPPVQPNQNYFKLLFGIYYETKFDKVLIQIVEYLHFKNTASWNNFVLKNIYQECILFEKSNKQDLYDELFIKRFKNNVNSEIVNKAFFTMIASVCTNLDEIKDRNFINLRYAYLVDYLKHKFSGKEIVYGLFEFSNVFKRFTVLFNNYNYRNISLKFGTGSYLLPKKDVIDVVDLLTFEEKIDILMNTSFMSKLTNYTVLFEVLNERCISLDIVQNNIKSYSSLAVKFYNLLLNGAFIHDQNYTEVVKYIEDIQQNDNIRQEFLNYRLEFSKKQFDLLDNEEKESLARNYGNVDEILVDVSETDLKCFNNRKKLLDDIYINYKNTFKVNIFKEEGLKKYFIRGIGWAFFEIIISCLLLLLVPTFKYFSLNLDFVFLVKEFMTSEMLVFLMYIIVLFSSIYFVNYCDNEVKDKRKCLRPALLYSFLLGILPLICFVATYLLVYYFGNGIVH